MKNLFALFVAVSLFFDSTAPARSGTIAADRLDAPAPAFLLHNLDCKGDHNDDCK